MAKKRTGPNKSEAIRAYYDENPEAKPKDVVAAMKEKRLTVTPAFVSTIRSKQLARVNQPPKRRGRPKGSTKMVASKRGAGRKAAASVSTDSLSLSSLLKAKELIAELGGAENAHATIDAVDQLSS